MEVRLEEQGIWINGEYKILLASSLFYFRIPGERWDRRMKLLKTAGYNAIDVYFPWNYHEIAPGKWDFEGNRDVAHFLRLAKENELYVVARPGPYICSEWDGGAIPAWLYAKGIKVRQDDPQFLHEMYSWYSHILPILAEYQITRKGTVIAMQIENELDFFDCKSPITYMGKLKKMAEGQGMEVPMFYCCGQDDIVKGGGLTAGLYSSFNVYADDGFDGLENRCLQLYNAALLRKMPFMITETNRGHSWIKRLTACGAKLLGPYNQTAGTTMDFYTGITNWGTKDKPVAIMTTDYDFKSMIGSAGNYGTEIIKSRLFAGLLHSFGEALAKAVPVKSNVYAEGKCINTIIPELQTPMGSFVEISNLGNSRDEVVFHAGNKDVPIELASLETRLLPIELNISENVKILFSTYEIASVLKENTGSEISLDGRIVVWLYGHGKGYLNVKGKSGEQIFDFAEPQDGDEFSFEDVKFIFGSDNYVSENGLPFLPPLAVKPDEQESVVDEMNMEIFDCNLACNNTITDAIRPMELYNQYRGIGVYEVTIPEDGQYLFSGLADIVTFISGYASEAAETQYCNGSTCIKNLNKGNLSILTEIWGHANFDDIRVKSLHMGSLKGIDTIMKINHIENLTNGWRGYQITEIPGETCYFRHSPYNALMNADGFNRAASPLITMINRTVLSDAKDDGLFLHFEKAEPMVEVYVNNQKVSSVVKDDPYIDLSAYAGSGEFELTFIVIRRYYTDEIGKVTLYSGKKVEKCSYSEVIPQKTGFAPGALPLRFKDARNKYVDLQFETREGDDYKLFFYGKNVKLTVYAGNHVMGRIFLSEHDTPAVLGGADNAVMVLGEWLKKKPVSVWCQAMESDAVLESIEIKHYKDGTCLFPA